MSIGIRREDGSARGGLRRAHVVPHPIMAVGPSQSHAPVWEGPPRSAMIPEVGGWDAPAQVTEVCMRVLVSGSTGFIGTRVVTALQEEGHEVMRLVRRKRGTAEPEVLWAPDDDVMEVERLDGVEAVVHLSGETIASRWNARKKREIRRSRVKTTAFLADVLANMTRPPRVLVSASAIGVYGNRGDELLSEDSAPGSGFLAHVCAEWEAATGAAESAGIRVVNLRIGMVLDPRGGALKLMLPAFRLGLGGRLGDGSQYVSWISADDLVGIILHALRNDGLTGPVNAVSPNPVTNAEFTRALAHALRRPALLPVPAVALRLVLGEMADETLLASARVNPRKLTAAEYRFKDPVLEGALSRMLARN